MVLVAVGFGLFSGKYTSTGFCFQFLFPTVQIKKAVRVTGFFLMKEMQESASSSFCLRLIASYP